MRLRVGQEEEESGNVRESGYFRLLQLLLRLVGRKILNVNGRRGKLETNKGGKWGTKAKQSEILGGMRELVIFATVSAAHRAEISGQSN